MKKKMVFTLFAIALYSILLYGCEESTAQPESCEPKGPFIILNNQNYALCATAACFSFNQVAYCECDLLSGDSISETFPYGNDQNICTLNQQGLDNGFRASTFSFPDEAEFPDGNIALYTCPGEMNKGSGVAARGTFAQCDGGLCFTSTSGNNFPGFSEQLNEEEIICSCPFSTICDPTSTNQNGYQISGSYSSEVIIMGNEGGCNSEDCGRCSAGALSEEQCELPNPIAQIGIQENVPVGAPAGTTIDLSILLLGIQNVPPTNSCLCQCVEADDDGICTQWTVADMSPIEVP